MKAFIFTEYGRFNMRTLRHPLHSDLIVTGPSLNLVVIARNRGDSTIANSLNFIRIDRLADRSLLHGACKLHMQPQLTRSHLINTF